MTEILLYARFCGKEKFDFESELFGCTVVFYLTKGSFEFSAGEAKGRANAGDAVICRAGVRFHRRAVEPMELHVIRLKTDVEHPHGLIRSASGTRIGEDLRRIGRDGLIMNFSEVERHYLLDVWYTLTSVRAVEPPCDRLMERAREVIIERLCENFTMEELSREFGLSPVGFLRRFRASFGVTPGEFLAAERTRRAIRLLTTTDLTLAAIAAECGFENEYYFSACFRKRIGIPPGRYRREARM